MTLQDWRELPAGRMRFERDVERYVAEPLLTWVMTGLPGATLVRQKEIAGGRPDYVAEVDSEVVLVVKVKQRVGRRPGQDWATVAEAQQVRRYMATCGCPGLLVDAHQVHIFGPDDVAPRATFDRDHVTEAELRGLAVLVAGNLAPARPAGSHGQSSGASTAR